MNSPDACPVCQPGIPDAALPLGDPESANGGTLASYECGLCGSAWQTWFDRHGWPVERLLAPVTAEQAGVNRGILTEALAEQGRERRHAA